MGCNAAKNVAVEPLDGNLSNGHAESRTVPVSPKHQQVLPVLEAEDLQEELLENSTVNNVLKGANGMSFDIAFEEDDSEDSNQKKLPPKRILERLDGPPPTPSLQQLQEKLEEAEIRRQQILAQRVQSAKIRNQIKKLTNPDSSVDDEDEEDNGFLKVPSETVVRSNNTYDVSFI